MKKIDDYRDVLRNNNLKATKIRLQVFELLASSRIAMSHSQISDLLNDQTLDKVTLYRTLNTFVENGLAHKVATEDRNWLYAIYDEHEHHQEHSSHNHAHFICDECEKIYCFPIEENTTFINQEKMDGFLIKQQEIRLHGRCPVCQ